MWIAGYTQNLLFLLPLIQPKYGIQLTADGTIIAGLANTAKWGVE
jgi:hypothetical protein